MPWLMIAALATFGLAGGGVAAASTTGSLSASAGHSMIITGKELLPSTSRELLNGTIEGWFAADGLTEVAASFTSSGQEVAIDRTTYGLAPRPLKEYAWSANVFGTHITPMKLVQTNTVVFPSKHSWAQYSRSGVCGSDPRCASALALDGALGPFITPSWITSRLVSHFLTEVGQPSEINGQHAIQISAATDPGTNT